MKAKLFIFLVLLICINFTTIYNFYTKGNKIIYFYNPHTSKISELQYLWDVEELWYQIWGGINNDEGSVVGTNGSIIFLGGNTVSLGAGGFDAFISTYNENGTHLWNLTWGGTIHEFVLDINIYNDNIYIIGYTYSFGAGLYDIFLVKYTSSGVQLWNQTWGAEKDDFGGGISINENMIYVVGTTNSSGNYDVCLIKYDISGNQIWNRTWGGVYEEIGNGIAVFNNYIYLIGYTKSFGAGGKDMFLVKYDTSGAYIWNRTWGGVDDESGRDIKVYENNIYITGYTYSFGKGLRDIFLNKYDFEGNLIMTQIWGEYWEESGKALFVDNKKVYIAGETNSFDVGNNDILLLVYNIDGTQLYYRTWGTPDSEYGNDVIVNNDSIYLVGTMKNFSASNENACLIKFRETMTSISSTFPIIIFIFLQIKESSSYSNILIPILIITIIATVTVVVGTLLYLRYKKKPSKRVISTIISLKQIPTEATKASKDTIEIKNIEKDTTESKIQESIEKKEPPIKEEKTEVTEVKEMEAISENEIQYIQSLEKVKLNEIISNFEEDFVNYLSPTHPSLIKIRLWKKDITENILPKLTYNAAKRLIIDIKKWEKEFSSDSLNSK